jgi:hypothetical protein
VALLLRTRFAFIMFAVSLLGFVINSIYQLRLHRCGDGDDGQAG